MTLQEYTQDFTQVRPRVRRIALRVLKKLTGPYWPSPPKKTDTSAQGKAEPQTGGPWDELELSTVRDDLYRDMERVDKVMPEGSRALDILADNAVNAPGGAQRSFKVRFDIGEPVAASAQRIIMELVDRTLLQEKVYGIARDMLKYGDNFQQVVVSRDFHVVRLMHMPANSMRRNENEQGLLKGGRKAGEWAFEQYEPETMNLIAGFLPWQIQHLRWNRSGGSKYGRPALYSARYPFRKLLAMEEALVMNWLTRAFARLKFILDTTGMSKVEAEKYTKGFMDDIYTRAVAVGQEGGRRLSVVRDLVIARSRENLGGKYVDSLNDVEVLDTSNTGFWNITAVEYWRNKFISATGVPKAHLGLEQDINAKATLQWQDERFARTVRRVQMMMSEFVGHTINIELALQGIDPKATEYLIEWPSPSTLDELDHSQAMSRFAQAAALLIDKGVLSPEYVALEWLKMTPSQWAVVKQNTRVADANGDQDQ